MFAQQESQRLHESEGERERMKGEGKERERKGKRRGGGGEFLRVSHPLGLLKCQLLSSWLAQFHSSRGRRKTRSSHDPPFLNTSRNYCRKRVSRDCCAIQLVCFLIAANHLELICPSVVCPAYLWLFSENKGAPVYANPNRQSTVVVVVVSSTDIDAWMVISTPFLVPALLDAGPSSDYRIWFSQITLCGRQRTNGRLLRRFSWTENPLNLVVEAWNTLSLGPIVVCSWFAMASWLPVSCLLVYVFVSSCYGNGSSLSSIGGVIGGGGGGAGGDTFFPDWGVGGGRAAQPTCLDIPRNLSLCHGIRYSKMRLPNLLDHDSMAEVIQQAASWVPLLNVRCHADTQLFLCSLFR